MAVEASLTPMVLLEPVCVVMSVAPNLLHAARPATKEGRRVEETAAVAAEGTGVAASFMGFLVNIYAWMQSKSHIYSEEM